MTDPSSAALGPALDFASLLPRADRAGVLHLPRGAEGQIAAAADELGFLHAEVDLADVGTKQDFLAALSEALSFPAWFGQNWDALEDCLTDMSWSNAEGYVLVLRHADLFRSHAEGDFLAGLRLLADVTTAWSQEDVPFWTFVELAADGIPLLPSLA